MNKLGHVYLVGAGPGDPDLLTLKAARLLARAEVVVHDRLVSAEILALASPTARCIFVGKAPRAHAMPQDEINGLLVALGRAGEVVVRLKGGDPFVFGRGSEEAMALSAAGIPFDVIPGITAAQGCAASAGVPLTHRGLATGVRFVTGHCREDLPLDLDWDGLADRDTTLVVYMGAAHIGEIACRLCAAGLDATTPVLAIANGTTPRERRLTARLDEIADASRRAAFGGPVLFVIGRVAGLHVDCPAARLADHLVSRHLPEPVYA
jgi:uroporphyrin-III C-methyltransferase